MKKIVGNSLLSVPSSGDVGNSNSTNITPKLKKTGVPKRYALILTLIPNDNYNPDPNPIIMILNWDIFAHISLPLSPSPSFSFCLRTFRDVVSWRLTCRDNFRFICRNKDMKTSKNLILFKIRREIRIRPRQITIFRETRWIRPRKFNRFEIIAGLLSKFVSLVYGSISCTTRNERLTNWNMYRI